MSDIISHCVLLLSDVNCEKAIIGDECMPIKCVSGDIYYLNIRCIERVFPASMSPKVLIDDLQQLSSHLMIQNGYPMSTEVHLEKFRISYELVKINGQDAVKIQICVDMNCVINMEMGQDICICK